MNSLIATSSQRQNAIPSNPNPPSPSQPKSAKDIIAANIQSLIEQLEVGHSDALTAYLNAMSHFHHYSFGNVLAIARQRSQATRVAGLYAWNQLGRRVRKGEKAIRILAPIVGRSRRAGNEADKDTATLDKPFIVGFRGASVFDVAQTEGADLPDIGAVTGDAGMHHARLIAFVEKQGITLTYSETIAPALGVSYGGRIVLLPGQSEANEFCTLVHELAHELLHKAERRTSTTKTMRETEAEAIAYVIGKATGLQAGTASADYIQLYHGNASLLAESLEVIQHTAASILEALNAPEGNDPS